MACILNSRTVEGVPSLLHQELLDTFGNEEIANYYFALLNDPDWMQNVYGIDYVKEAKKPESERLIKNTDHTIFVNEYGEPKIHVSKISGQSFIYTKDGNKFFLDAEKLVSDPVVKEALINGALMDLFFENIEANKDILEDVDFKKLYQPGTNTYNILKGDPIKTRELGKLVKTRLRSLGLIVKDKENYLEDGAIDKDTAENSKELDLSVSIEKNPKENASINTKLLLSLIPDMEIGIDENGEEYYSMVMEKHTLDSGDVVELPVFQGFNSLHGKLLEALSDVTVVNNGETVTNTLFDEFISRLDKTYPDDITIEFITNKLLEMPEYKQNEFVHSFNHTKNKLTTTLINEKNGVYEYSIFDSSSPNSRQKKIEAEWNNSFISKKFVEWNEETKKHTYNKAEAEKYLLKLQQYRQKLNDRKVISEALINDTLDILHSVGINISKKGLISYLGIEKTTNKIAALKAINQNGGLLSTIYETIKNTTDADINSRQGVVSPLTKFLSKEDIKLKGRSFGVRGKINDLIEHELKYRPELVEQNVKGAKSKSYYLQSSKTYLSNLISQLKAGNKKALFPKSAFYKRSRWVKQIERAIEMGDTAFLNKLGLATFGNLRKQDAKDEGTDNSDITPTDQLLDQINKLLYSRTSADNQSLFYTPTPADKRSLHHIQGFELVNTHFDGAQLNDEVVNIFIDYLIDELYRAEQEYDLIKDETAREKNKNQLVNEYHFKLKDNKPYFFYYEKDNKVILTNDQTIEGIKPAGNAFKTYLFPDINAFSNTIIKHQGQNIFDPTTKKFRLSDQEIKSNATVRQIVNNRLAQVINDSIERLKEFGIINEENKLVGIDQRTEEFYKDYQNPLESIVADFVINSSIANIEYSKLFMGDYAYAKSKPNENNLVDLSKRYPSTYTDGNYLNTRKGDPTYYTVATMPNIIAPSVILKEDTPSWFKKAYSNINTTDAQGWITFDRWKFIQQRANHWNPKMDAAIKRIEAGTATHEDWKYMAQPVKGVHAGKSKDGVYTYVKYSALPLVPSVIKGTKLEELHEAMKKQGVDEAVVVDGLKIGARIPSDIDALQFNTMQLRNDEYKIQQDLTPKGVKQGLLGSQIMRNVLEGLTQDIELANDKLGKEVIQALIDTYSELSNRGIKNVMNTLGIDENGKIIDKDKFNHKVIQNLSSQKISADLVNALEQGISLNLIANKQHEIQQVLSAIIKKEAVDVKINGAGYIQASSWWFDVATAEESGVKWLVEPSRLRPAEIVEVDGKKILKPGQVFITSSYISKLLPNWKSMSMEELNKALPPEAKKLIGYRIPNQGFSSSDSLEIIGILDEAYGDTIVPYAEITTKTGSDFDIDKIYTMIPNLKRVYEKRTELLEDLITNNTVEDLKDKLIENGWEEASLEDLTQYGYNNKAIQNNLANLVLDEGLYEGTITPKIKGLEYIKYDDSKPISEQSVYAVQNKLIETVQSILESPALYERIMSPIDSPALKDDIMNLTNAEKELTDIEFFGPLYQLDKKFDNSVGKAGTGLASNQLVDIPLKQLADFKLNADLLFVGTPGQADYNITHDVTGEYRIADVVSWFLSAYVDIAKDPWISKGNHNPETANVVFMLIRAGAPFKVVNRIVDQESVREYIKEKASRNSRISEYSPLTVEQAAVQTLIDKYKIPTTLDKLPSDVETLSKKIHKLREAKDYVKMQELLESLNKKPSGVYKPIPKDLNVNSEEYKKAYEANRKVVRYVVNQADILNIYNDLESIADEFSKTILSTKQDVKGNGKNFIDAFVNRNQVELYKENPLFTNYDKLFTSSFLSAFYNNSVEKAIGLFENTFLIGNKNAGRFYNYVSYLQTNGKQEALVNATLGVTLEKGLYAYALGQTDLGQPNYEELFYGEDSMYNRLYSLKTKYPDNVFLSLLEGNTAGKYKFIKLDNTKDRSPEIMDKFTLAWEKASKQTTDLELRRFAKDAIRYAYTTSGFKKDMNSFFEHIPIKELLATVEGGLQEFQTSLNEGTFNVSDIMDKIYRNNADDPQLVPQITRSKINDKLNFDTKTKVLYLSPVYQGSYANLHSKPYIALKDKGMDETNAGTVLYKKVGKRVDNGQYVYIPVPKLGIDTKAGRIYEYHNSIVDNSAFIENHVLRGSDGELLMKIAEANITAREAINEMVLNNEITVFGQTSINKVSEDYISNEDLEKGNMNRKCQ